MPVISISSSELLEISRQILIAESSLKLKACGNSMWPFIQDKDILLVKQAANKIRKFDILVFRDCSNILKCHRVICVSNDGNGSLSFLLQGDNLPWTDGWINDEYILGRVEQIERDSKCYHLTRITHSIVVAWHLFVKPFIKIRWRLMRWFK